MPRPVYTSCLCSRNIKFLKSVYGVLNLNVKGCIKRHLCYILQSILLWQRWVFWIISGKIYVIVFSVRIQSLMSQLHKVPNQIFSLYIPRCIFFIVQPCRYNPKDLDLNL